MGKIVEAAVKGFFWQAIGIVLICFVVGFVIARSL